MMPITDDDIAAMRRAIEDTFITLRYLPVESMTSEQRDEHRIAFNMAYEAVIALEHAAMARLTKEAKVNAAKIRRETLQLQADLAGFKRTDEVLGIVRDALGLLSELIKIFA